MGKLLVPAAAAPRRAVPCRASQAEEVAGRGRVCPTRCGASELAVKRQDV